MPVMEMLARYPLMTAVSAFALGGLTGLFLATARAVRGDRDGMARASGRGKEAVTRKAALVRSLGHHSTAEPTLSDAPVGARTVDRESAHAADRGAPRPRPQDPGRGPDQPRMTGS